MHNASRMIETSSFEVRNCKRFITARKDKFHKIKIFQIFTKQKENVSRVGKITDQAATIENVVGNVKLFPLWKALPAANKMFIIFSFSL